MFKILIAEDEEPIAKLMKMSLVRAGYECVWAADGKEAADLMEKEGFDLVLLDIMLPVIDGYELLEYAKQLGYPVIFITALGSVQEKVKGLQSGADDYLAKPFEIAELLARVEAVLRRFYKAGTLIEAEQVCIDLLSHTVWANGAEVNLTMKEFELLVLFVNNRNIALYRSFIYEKVWGGEYSGQSRTVDLHVQRLKKKLGWEEQITAVYKVGYRFRTTGENGT